MSKNKKKKLSPEEKSLKKQSKAFYALPKNEQRKKVAMDVIYLLKNKQLNLQSRELFGLDEDVPEIPNGTQLALFLPALLKSKKCFVCGLGACFVSIVNLADNYKVKSKLSEHESYKKQYKHVVKVFGYKNAMRIEIAFEQGEGSLRHYVHGKKLSSDDFRVASEFGTQLGLHEEDENNDNKRLIKIMENVIEFDGEFTPPDFNIQRKLSLPMEMKEKSKAKKKK